MNSKFFTNRNENSLENRLKEENLNSQMRDKISYFVRRTKAHSKSFD